MMRARFTGAPVSAATTRPEIWADPPTLSVWAGVSWAGRR